MKDFIFLGALFLTAKSIPSSIPCESKLDSALVLDELHNPANIKLEWGNKQTFMQISPSDEENVYKIIINKPPDCSRWFSQTSGQTIYDELLIEAKEIQLGKCDGISPFYFPDNYAFKMLEIGIDGFQVTPGGHGSTLTLPIVQVLATDHKPDSRFLQCLNDTFVEPTRSYGEDFYRCTVSSANQTRLMVYAFFFVWLGRNKIIDVVRQCQNRARNAMTTIHSNANNFYHNMRGRAGWIPSVQSTPRNTR